MKLTKTRGNVGEKSGNRFKRLLLTSSVGLCRLSIILLHMTWVAANWVGVLQSLGISRDVESGHRVRNVHVFTR